jgi:hypothetical protein
MPHSPIHSKTSQSWTLVALTAAVAGCSDDAATCGPGDALAAGLTLNVAGETAMFGAFTASVNNDCTIADSGVISVSVHGSQIGSGFPVTFCLPRPDLLGATPVALVPSRTPPMAEDRVQVIDTSAMLSSGCTVMKDVEGDITGTATFDGYCETSSLGYALSVTGEVPLIRTCGATTDSVVGTLGGRVAVAVQ